MQNYVQFKERMDFDDLAIIKLDIRKFKQIIFIILFILIIIIVQTIFLHFYCLIHIIKNIHINTSTHLCISHFFIYIKSPFFMSILQQAIKNPLFHSHFIFFFILLTNSLIFSSFFYFYYFYKHIYYINQMKIHILLTCLLLTILFSKTLHRRKNYFYDPNIELFRLNSSNLSYQNVPFSDITNTNQTGWFTYIKLMDGAPIKFPPFFNLLGGPQHSKVWTSQIMATTYLQFDKTISHIVKLKKKGCYEITFDYALNTHAYDAPRKAYSQYEIVFNQRIIKKVAVVNFKIRKQRVRVRGIQGLNNFTIIGRNVITNKVSGKDIRTFRSSGLDNFSLHRCD